MTLKHAQIYYQYQLEYLKDLSLVPFFFIIYVNDLFNCGTDSVKFIMFADGTNIFISASSTDELYSKANNMLMLLMLLKNYIDANYLHINLKKSKYMQFRSGVVIYPIT